MCRTAGREGERQEKGGRIENENISLFFTRSKMVTCYLSCGLLNNVDSSACPSEGQDKCWKWDAEVGVIFSVPVLCALSRLNHFFSMPCRKRSLH